MQQLLAVLGEPDEAQRVLARARFLAAQFHARLRLLLPVQSPLGDWQKYLPAGNVESVREAILAAETARFDALRGADEGEVIWCERRYRGIADRALAMGADLILMEASRHGLLENLIHHADDWHLLREAPCPVLLLPRKPQPIRAVIAAVDALAEGPEQELLAERVLDAASAFAHAEQVPLRVVTVMPDPALIYASPVAVPLSADLITELQARAGAAQRELLERIGLRVDEARIETGRVEDVLAAAAADGLLVIGSVANRGLKGLVLGNTAERILRHMTTEMLVVN
ncbi:MAG: universal stress protein [Pseudomonadota bacterium]